MMLVRPVRTGDLSSILDLAHSAGVGLTTLPPDEKVLTGRIRDSVRALETDVRRPAGQSYLLVMEDLTTGAVVGTSGMVAKVGGYEPFYSYQLRTTHKISKALDVDKEVRYLELTANHSGPTEIGTLFLLGDHRKGGNGRLLSLSRFLFMASHRQRFDKRVIAEMRGVSTTEGHSLFWEAIGRHFFNIGFAEADQRSAADKSFIGELMPQHPIYIPMLAPDVQAVIGQVHEETRPALRLVEDEGFAFDDQVDIFDAGPLMAAPIEKIRAIRKSKVARVRSIVRQVPDETTWLIANTRDQDFRACAGHLAVIPPESEGPWQVDLPRDVALALGLRLGDEVRYVAPRAPKKAKMPEWNPGDGL
ncbi:MAG: arginine N-succinyltransferase [Bradymonadia bacterium]